MSRSSAEPFARTDRLEVAGGDIVIGPAMACKLTAICHRREPNLRRTPPHQTTVARGLAVRNGRRSYSPMVRMTLLSGRVLLDDSLSSCASISSYFGTVVASPFGTMCTIS